MSTDTQLAIYLFAGAVLAACTFARAVRGVPAWAFLPVLALEGLWMFGLIAWAAVSA